MVAEPHTLPTSRTSLPLASASAPAPLAVSGRQSSHAEILKSTGLIGGSTLLGVIISIARVKAFALLLGPSGIGVMSLYTAIVDVARSASGMGLGSSGVRQIAAAVGSGDATRVARTATVVRRVAVVLGLLGATCLLVLSPAVAAFSFGDARHGVGIAILSLAVLFSLLGDGQSALLQGTRRIADIAKVGLIGASLGSACAIALVSLYGSAGIAPGLVAVAAASAGAAWWYARKVKIQAVVVPMSQLRSETVELLQLGVAFMASALLMMGAAYVARLIVLRQVGLDAAGLYQAAWAIGGLYVGFILQAMGADFYPRLVAVANDDPECNRLVNEQAHVSLLLAGPGVIATLVLAPVVLSLFYTANFVAAVEVLRWICLGVALRVISWPMGFVIVAKNRRVLFLSTEVAWTVVNLAATWLCVTRYGLVGAGIAFFLSYVFHVLIIYPAVHRLSGFRWSALNLQTALLFMGLTAALWFGLHALDRLAGMVVGGVAIIGSTLYSLHSLATLVPLEQVPRRLRPLVALLAQRRTTTPLGS
jgi:antigen flippase